MLQSCCNYVDAYSITEESEALRCFRLNSSLLEGCRNLTLIHSNQNSQENSGETKEDTGGEQKSWPLVSCVSKNMQRTTLVLQTRSS